MIFEAAKSIGDYRAGLRSAVRGLWSGVIDSGQFQDFVRSAINRWLTEAWLTGAAECGVAEDELTSEEFMALGNAIRSELGHVRNLADRVEKNSREKGGKLTSLFTALNVWTGRYTDLQNRAKRLACADRKLEWRLGATELHCRTCNRLHGKVKRGSYWEASGLHPQSPPNNMLECGGWRCECVLTPTDKPVSRGRLPGGRSVTTPPKPKIKPLRGFEGEARFTNIGTATARALPDGSIAVNEEMWNQLNPDEQRFVLAHEVIHQTIEDFILRDQAEWDKAEEILTISTLRDGRRLFAGGNFRIGEAAADAIAATMTDARFGEMKEEQWRQITTWANSVTERAGFDLSKLRSGVDRLFDSLR